MKKTLLGFFVLVLLATMVDAQCGVAGGLPPPVELEELAAGLADVGGALGALMITIVGVRWIIADNPQERSEAKKGIIYIIVGLLVVVLAPDLVTFLYCERIVV